MAMPLRQSLRLGSHLIKQKLLEREKFPMHCLGDTVVLNQGMAASLLSARRRVRRHLPGPDPHDQLAIIRPWQRPAGRQLNGPLRL
jgi:hypothetical protein